MTPTLQSRLEIALGMTEPLPWPASLDEELALAERNLGHHIRDHVPQLAPKHKVRGVLAALDRIERENHNRRFNT